MDLEKIIIPAVTAFIGVAALGFFLRRRPKVALEGDDRVLARNASAYRIVTALFLVGLLTPIPLYEWMDIDDNAAWPAALGFTLAVVLPTLFLWARKKLCGGPEFDEFLRYGELKDNMPRNLQLGLYGLWLVITLIAIIFALADWLDTF